jgi:glycosyltransferase involved in cell wall biosynthesis
MKFAFYQPFSLGEMNGGSKILRSVAEHSPIPVISLCSAYRLQKPQWQGGREMLLPFRPTLGRIDRSRFFRLGYHLEEWYRSRFQRKLEAWIAGEGITHLHITPHHFGDFIAAHQACKKTQTHCLVSIHDDYRHTASGKKYALKHENKLGHLWQQADVRFVITRQLGDEYNNRYGKAIYHVHTDGCRTFPPPQLKAAPACVNVFYMGLFIPYYRQNFDCLLEALGKAHEQSMGTKTFKLILRTEGYQPTHVPAGVAVEARGFTSPDIVERELQEADLVYLPLPFANEWSNLNRFSLSTKMVSYLHSGIPILYHGPAQAAAYEYLKENKCALHWLDLEANPAAQKLLDSFGDSKPRIGLSTAARQVAVRDFDAETLRHQFWTQALAPNSK